MAITNGAAIISNTGGQGDAGTIRLFINDRLEMGEPAADGTPSVISTAVGQTAIGNGGNIFITADELAMTRSLITAASGGQGNAGNIEIGAGTVRLNDAIVATTGRTENGGNLVFRGLDILLLDNGAKITAATQVTGAQGNGGNVSIDSDLIVAVPDEDSDIAANAEGGRGGNINITTQGIFGIEPRPERSPLTSEINASSRLSVDGTVTITQPDVEPTGAIALPTEFSPPLLAQNCLAQGSRNRFVNTGRGGLPTNPADPLVAEELWQDLGESDPEAAIEPTAMPEEIDRPQTTLTEAQGWIVDSEGNVILIAAAPTATPYIGVVAGCTSVPAPLRDVLESSHE
ncbi:S-layer family protein [Oculatella sp. LEGE 06141]|nr:S-layer family protein [Oculatella sp. LEGE 06141]